MFCIVSWHHEGRDLSFWDGMVWGVSLSAKFFDTRTKATASLRNVKQPMGPGFLKPNVLDVDAYNKKFGRSISPRQQIQVTSKLDQKTGIVERVETPG